MAFINKKEEVIKLRLTQHGKYLLSTGKFRPDSYAFFDDDIIYDSRYGGISEHQNEAQDRIKDQARRDAQHVSMGIQTRYGIATEELAQGGEEFKPFVGLPSDTENEKILGFPLTNMSLGSQEVPRFELNVFESEIENQEATYDMMDGARIRIPQLEFAPEHVLIRDGMNVDPLVQDPGTLVDSETFQINPIASKIEFMDGSFLEHQPENIIFSLEEMNTEYLKENFEVEVFEIVEEAGNQKLIPIENYQYLFEIEKDDQVTEVPKKNNQRRGFFR
jgi:hypothetical protein